MADEDIPSLTLRLLRELHTKVDRLDADLRGQVDGLHGELGSLRAEMRAELDVLHEDLRGVRVRVQTMDTEMRAGFAAVMQVLAAVDARVTRIERQ